MAQEGTLALAVALTAGMVAHALARHLRIPVILALLLAGVAMGPDGAGLLKPHALRGNLHALVDAAVAFILFEGGLRLELRRLRCEPAVIRRLVTIGGVLSALGAALACRWIQGWGLRESGLFGVLVMVTGPTVIEPLLDALRVRRRVATVLQAEGVLIDALGAVTAAVALEVAIHPSEEGLLLAAPSIALRLLTGVVVGLSGGAVLALALRTRRALPSDLRNVFVLAFVILIHQASNALLAHSGLVAATAAGLTLANIRSGPTDRLSAFNQQLVHLLIGMLFLLLVADVRLSSVLALGWAGLVTVMCLILLVRPLAVALCTVGSVLSWRERALVAWLGPRGVVSAAVASLVAYELARIGESGGLQLRALVFLTITVSVIWCCVTGPWVARWLGLRRPAGDGWVVLGGNALALELARTLQSVGERAVVIDNDPHVVRDAEGSGLRALHGNAYEGRMLARAELDGRAGAVAVTSNPDANMLFVQQARMLAPDTRYLVALRDALDGVTPELVGAEGAEVLFRGPTDVTAWSKRLRGGRACTQWWRYRGPGMAGLDRSTRCAPFVALVKRARTGRACPVGDTTQIMGQDDVAFLIDLEREYEAHLQLRRQGFEPLAVRDDDASAPAAAAS